MSDAFQSTPQAADPVAELVGEGKKFKDIAALAAGKKEADAFIDKLQKEQAALRQELGAKVDAEAALTQLREEVKQLRERNVTPSKENTTPALSANDVKSLVERTITETEQSKTAAQNIAVANELVVKHYGDLSKAQDAVRQKAQELGMSVDDLKSLAAKSPTAFAKMVLPGQTNTNASGSGSNTSGSVNTSALPALGSGGPQPGTKEYYDAIRVKNPKQYWTPKIQNEIMKAAENGTYNHWDGIVR